MPKVVPSAVSEMKALRVYPHHRIIPHIRVPVHPIADGVLSCLRQIRRGELDEPAKLRPIEARAELEQAGAGGVGDVAPGPAVLVLRRAAAAVPLRYSPNAFNTQVSVTAPVPSDKMRIVPTPSYTRFRYADANS